MILQVRIVCFGDFAILELTIIWNGLTYVVKFNAAYEYDGIKKMDEWLEYTLKERGLKSI